MSELHRITINPEQCGGRGRVIAEELPPNVADGAAYQNANGASLRRPLLGAWR